MSAETLRKAAAAIRDDCPILDAARAMDFIDFPTGWALQGADEVAHDERCSATQSGGGLLCDCEALLPMWVRWKTLLAVADWLAECARLWEYGDVGPLMWQQANTVARAYLGGDA